MPKRFARSFQSLRNLLLIELTGFAVRLLFLSVRVDAKGYHRAQEARARHGGVIYAFWHNTILLPLGHDCRRGVLAVVSAGRDGEFAARVLRRSFGVHSVRGSSSRRGATALRALLRQGEGHKNLAFTPDGPRGPRYSVQPGIALAAAFTGLPVIPLGASVSRAWRLKSWDRFRIPKPFSRVVLVFGDPVQLPREAGQRSEREDARQTIERALFAASRAAAEETGESWPDPTNR